MLFPLLSSSQKHSAVASHLHAAETATKPLESHYRDGKKHLHISPKHGEKMDTCATHSETDYVCCNVKVLKSVSNCPFDCSYCFLQNYLNDGTTQVVGDIDALMAEVNEKIAAQPWRIFRIGTWELGDSLALEDLVGQAHQLIERFAALPNVFLELKTKSDCVDSILNSTHNERTVVSWSMNTDFIIRSQEHRTATLEQRISALKKVQDAGYLIGLHFDPMIRYDGWESGYDDLIDRIFAVADPKRIAWISIGSLRFNPEMKTKMEQNFPATDLTLQEMVLGPDGKVRYVKPLRVEMYKRLYQALMSYCGSDSLIYFCMERWDVWEKVMGYSPTSMGHLDAMFGDSLCQRFPHLNLTKPDRFLYESSL